MSTEWFDCFKLVILLLHKIKKKSLDSSKVSGAALFTCSGFCECKRWASLLLWTRQKWAEGE